MKHPATDSELAYCLSAAVSVDSTSGILRGVTVAKAGVQAKGKFVYIDGAGNITRDPKLAKTKLPVFTDEEMLDTLMGAAQDAGGRVKVRSDHDDSLAARAGFATNFRKVEDRVVCDLHLNQSYRDRATVLETAQKSPDLIGCSIDFVPTFVLTKDKAMMRVSDLSAVDIVDEGAVTPGGLFMRRGVDNETEDSVPISQTDPLTTMAKTEDKKLPTIEECVAAMAVMNAAIAELAASIKSINAQPAVPMSAVDELKTQLAAERAEREKLATEQKEFITAQTEKLATMARERAALGLRVGEVKKLTEAEEQETERVRLAAERDADAKKPKTYLALVQAKKAEGKLSAHECHRYVMTTNPKAYADHQIELGLVRRPAA